MKNFYLVFLFCLFASCGSADINSENERLSILISDKYDTLKYYKELLPNRFELIESDLYATKKITENVRTQLQVQGSDDVKNDILNGIDSLSALDADNVIKRLILAKPGYLTIVDLQVIELELLNSLIDKVLENDLKYVNTFVPIVMPKSLKIDSGENYEADVFMIFVRPEFPDRVRISGENFTEIEVPRDKNHIFSFQLTPEQYKKGENNAKIKYILNDGSQVDTVMKDFIFIVE